MNFGSLNIFLEFKLNKEIGKGFTSDWASFWPTTDASRACGPLGVAGRLGHKPARSLLSRPRPGPCEATRRGAPLVWSTRCLSTHVSLRWRRARFLGLRHTGEGGRRATSDLHNGDDVRRRREVGRRSAML
jgi:hypothetical protein